MEALTGYNQALVAANKEEWLKVRITAAEKEQFSLHAENAGLSLSAWIRFNLKAVVKAEGPLTPPPAKKNTKRTRR